MAIIEAYGKSDNSVPGGANPGGRFECIGGWLRRWQFRANQTIGGIPHNSNDTDHTDNSNNPDDAHHAANGRNDSDQPEQ